MKIEIEEMPYPSIPPHFLDRATAIQIQDFKTLLTRAGFRSFERDGRTCIRLNDIAGALIQVDDLAFDDEHLNQPSLDALASEPLLGDDDSLTHDIRSYFSDTYGGLVSPSDLHSLGIRLMSEDDTASVLESFHQANPGVSFFRVRTTERMHTRDIFWRVMTKASGDGTTWAEMLSPDGWPVPDRVSGGLTATVSHWCVSPLIARMQPMAASWRSFRGLEIVGVPHGLWNRPPLWDNFPAASDADNLRGSGEGLYRSRSSTVPHDLALTAFRGLVRGADETISLLTDPVNWVADDGQLNVVERNISWSSVNLALNALTELGQNWGSGESLWVAFRVLGILQGLWEGGAHNSVPLSSIIHPHNVRSGCTPYLRPARYREWAEDICDNYAAAIADMFSGISLDEAVARVADLRNLLHGTGARQNRRDDRLNTLLALAGDGVQLIQDVASFWAMSLLMNSDTHARVGVPPPGL